MKRVDERDKRRSCIAMVNPLCYRWALTHIDVGKYIQELIEKDMRDNKPFRRKENKLRIFFTIPPECLEWARAHGNMSGYIAQLIEDDMLGKNL